MNTGNQNLIMSIEEILTDVLIFDMDKRNLVSLFAIWPQEICNKDKKFVVLICNMDKRNLNAVLICNMAIGILNLAMWKEEI